MSEPAEILEPLVEFLEREIALRNRLIERIKNLRSELKSLRDSSAARCPASKVEVESVQQPISTPNRPLD
jgi:hypothetical protein